MIILQNILTISRIDEEKYLWMDSFTVRNLELFYSPNKGAKTLIEILDCAETAMGSRMLSRWLALPLKNINQINERLDIVEFFNKDYNFSEIIQDNLKNIGDLERLVSKVSTRRVNPREIQKLKESLKSIIPIKNQCEISNLSSLQKMGSDLDICEDLINKIQTELVENPPAFLHKGNIINEGVNLELDELKNIKNSGEEYLDKMLKYEIEKTSIPSLKISYNNVFGYF